MLFLFLLSLPQHPKITTRVPFGAAELRRLNIPSELSPLIPSLATLTLSPCWCNNTSSLAGQASVNGSKYPLVELSPKATTCAFAFGGCEKRQRDDKSQPAHANLPFFRAS